MLDKEKYHSELKKEDNVIFEVLSQASVKGGRNWSQVRLLWGLEA